MFGKKAKQRRALRGLAMMEQMQGNLVRQWSDDIADRLRGYTNAQQSRYGDEGPAQIVQPLVNAMDMHNAAVDAYEAGRIDEAAGRCKAVTEWLDEVAPTDSVHRTPAQTL